MLKRCGPTSASTNGAGIAPTVPPHPGEVLYGKFLIPRGLTETALALHLGVSVNSINDLVCQRRSVSTAMARMLAAALSTTPRFWLDLRSDYELWQARDLPLPPPIGGRPGIQESRTA